MTGLVDSCKKFFNCSSLYEVLEIEKDASESAVKKAYYKLSLKVHPDRVGEQEKENATEKFQILGKVYSILSDKEKRKVYDETGVAGDDDFFESDKNWDEYWRLLFKKITEEDIIKFEKQYKGSEEEKNDIKNLYEESKGNMDTIMDCLMCSTADDEPRIREIIEEMIEKKEVKKFKAFTAESQQKKEKRKRKADKEAAEAEELAKEMGLRGGEDSLTSLILKKQKAREDAAEDFFSALEAKYAGKSAKKGGAAKKKQKIDEEEESDDEKPKTSKRTRAGKKK